MLLGEGRLSKHNRAAAAAQVCGQIFALLSHCQVCRDKFDFILIETTGLADPGALASIFWLDDELESQVRSFLTAGNFNLHLP